MTLLLGRMDICRCAWHACPKCLGLEQLAELSPPQSAGGHSVSGHGYTSALSEDASLHQQRHAKKVCLAAAYRKSANPLLVQGTRKRPYFCFRLANQATTFLN